MELVTDTAALRPNVVVPSDDNRGLLIPLMSRKDRVVFFCLAAVWAVSLFSFLGWWLLNPEHNSGPVRFVINSLVLFWATVIPGDFIFIFSRCRKPDPSRRLPVSWPVAMVVTKAILGSPQPKRAAGSAASRARCRPCRRHSEV